jgi:hypothetical protein
MCSRLGVADPGLLHRDGALMMSQVTTILCMLTSSHTAACISMLCRSSMAAKALEHRQAAPLSAPPGMHSCWRLCLSLAPPASPATLQLRGSCSQRFSSMRAFSTKQQKGGQVPSAGVSKGAASSGTHNDAVQQLDMLSKMLDTHYSVPGTGLKLGVETVVGKLPLAGGCGCWLP